MVILSKGDWLILPFLIICLSLCSFQLSLQYIINVSEVNKKILKTYIWSWTFLPFYRKKMHFRDEVALLETVHNKVSGRERERGKILFT
jgi:hypothetical protein